MLLLFTHGLTPEDSLLPDLGPLFVLAAETLTGLLDLLWVWLQRIDRANHRDWELELLNRHQHQLHLDHTLKDLNFFKEIEEQTRRYSEVLSEMYSPMKQHLSLRRKNLGKLQRLRKSDRQVESRQVARLHLRDLAGTRSKASPSSKQKNTRRRSQASQPALRSRPNPGPAKRTDRSSPLPPPSSASLPRPDPNPPAAKISRSRSSPTSSKASTEQASLSLPSSSSRRSKTV